MKSFTNDLSVVVGSSTLIVTPIRHFPLRTIAKNTRLDQKE